jgi:citrate synthase
MKAKHVDSAVKQEDFLDAREATALLGVKLQTLYAYASRGLIESVAGPSGRARRYARADLERLKARHEARSGHGPVAAGAMRWGEPVLDSAITAIDGRGPHYRGHTAAALAEEGVSFEAVAELLWVGQLPPQAPQWPRPSFDLKALAPLLPEDAAPLTTMALLLPAMAARDPERFAAPREADVARARLLLATLGAALVPAPTKPAPAKGKAPPKSKGRGAAGIASALATALGHGNVEATALLNRALILVADHELNVSTFTARVAASAGADLYACVSAALSAASGPLHGGACDRIEAFVADIGKPERARAAVTERARRGEAIPGFGHPLYPDGDPRAVTLLQAAEKLAPKASPLRTLLALVKAMEETDRGRPTIDTALVALCLALGARPGTAASLFALGRCAGWVAHVLEQRDAAVLLRPRVRYVGATPPA